jgi:hypothetical protein
MNPLITDLDDGDDSMPDLQSVSVSDSSYDSEDSEQVPWSEKPRAPRSLSYKVSELIPLSTSPAWDEINALLNIRLTGPDSFKGLCDEAHFARSHL